MKEKDKWLPMKYIFMFLTSPITVPYAIGIYLYQHYTKKVYMLTGTGINTGTGKRMWLRTTFHSVGNIMPLKSLEDRMAKHSNLDSFIVLNIVRIPNEMEKYITQDFESDIEIRETIVTEPNP